MLRLPDDLIEPGLFPPELIATCTRFRNKIPANARAWLRNCTVDPLPTGDLAREGDRARVTLIRAFRDNWITRIDPVGALAAADWILSFGLGACGAAIEAAPEDWRPRMLALGARPYPASGSTVSVGPVDGAPKVTGVVRGICGLTMGLDLGYRLVHVRTDEAWPATTPPAEVRFVNIGPASNLAFVALDAMFFLDLAEARRVEAERAQAAREEAAREEAARPLTTLETLALDPTNSEPLVYRSIGPADEESRALSVLLSSMFWIA